MAARRVGGKKKKKKTPTDSHACVAFSTGERKHRPPRMPVSQNTPVWSDFYFPSKYPGCPRDLEYPEGISTANATCSGRVFNAADCSPSFGCASHRTEIFSTSRGEIRRRILAEGQTQNSRAPLDLLRTEKF